MNTESLTQQHIKHLHLKEIYLRVLQGKGVSRAQLKKDMNLSFPSVSALVEEMLQNGILIEAGMQESTQRGRPSILLQINPAAWATPVVTITPDCYRYCLYNAKAELLEEGILPLNKPEGLTDRWAPDAQTICQVLTKWLTSLNANYKIYDLVLSVSGSFDAKGKLTSSAWPIKLPDDFLQYIQAVTGLGICLINTSDAEAYTERLLQPLSEDLAFIHIGKGVGAGIIRKGKIYDNNIMRAGEIGHISIDHKGLPCPCGNRGCLERYISTAAFCREASAILGRQVESFDEVCSLYKQGIRPIVEMVDGKAELLTVGISNMIAVQPVTYVVLGGGIEKLGQAFLEQVRSVFGTVGFRKYMDRISVTYTVNTSGSGARGALWNYLLNQMKIERMLK